MIDAAAYVRYQWHRPQIADQELHRIRHRVDKHFFHTPKEKLDSNPILPDDVIEPEDSGGGLWRHSFNAKDVKPSDLAKDYPGKSADDYYVLFPRVIIGLIMKDKIWGKLLPMMSISSEHTTC